MTRNQAREVARLRREGHKDLPWEPQNESEPATKGGPVKMVAPDGKVVQVNPDGSTTQLEEKA